MSASHKSIPGVQVSTSYKNIPGMQVSAATKTYQVYGYTKTYLICG